MGFARKDTRKLQETDLTAFTRTCIGAKFTFTGTGLNNMTDKLCWDTKNKIRNKRFWLNVHLVRNKLPTQNTGNHTEMFIRRTRKMLRWKTDIIRQELQAEAYDIYKGTEEHDLEKLGNDKGGKSALFNSNDTVIL